VGREPIVPRTPFLGVAGWTAVLAAVLTVAVVVPASNLLLPEGHPLRLSDFAVQLVGKIMCYAIAALAMDLIWGYAGILSLGHGVFFALGGYAMGMYLMRQIGRDGQYRMDMPDFMVFLNWKEYPWHWALSDSFLAQMALVVLAPGALAFVFGYFAFRSRIKGVYFSIITQAMTFAAMLLFFRNETGFGGNNGFTDFKRILDVPIATPGMRVFLFALTGSVLIGFYLMSRALVRSKFGPQSCRRSATPRAGHVHRLRPAPLQARDLGPLGRDVTASPGPCSCRRSGSSTRESAPAASNRDRRLGRSRRAAAR
jgi:urea transport system permease protein